MEDREGEVARWLPDARLGRPDALGRLLEGYRGYLLLIAQEELDPALRAKTGASDVVQETFLEAQRDLVQFKGGTEAEFRGWLRQLLLHNLANLVRHYRDTAKRQVKREVEIPVPDSCGAGGSGPAAPIPTPSVQAMARESVEVIRRAMEQLPEDYRQILLLRYEEERSFEEIGQRMNRTANAARKLWARAVERLQQVLEHGS
jgi:RNA polymerase sigma-70 factor (ECF subfamily)